METILGSQLVHSWHMGDSSFRDIGHTFGPNGFSRNPGRGRVAQGAPTFPASIHVTSATREGVALSFASSAAHPSAADPRPRRNGALACTLQHVARAWVAVFDVCCLGSAAGGERWDNTSLISTADVESVIDGMCRIDTRESHRSLGPPFWGSDLGFVLT